MANLYFAKINVNGEIYKVYKDELSIDSVIDKLIVNISTEKSIILPDNKGQIKFITLINNLDKRYISGRLIRIFQDDIQIYEKSKDDVIDLTNKDLARTCTFFFDGKSEIVGFTTGRYFGTSQFCKYFEELLNEHTAPGCFNVTLIKDTDAFRNKLNRLKTVNKVNIRIVAKNSCDDDLAEWYANNDTMEDMEANQAEITYESKGKQSGGLNMNNAYISSIIDSLGLGYGRMTAIGVNAEGIKDQVVSDKDAPMKIKIADNNKTSMPYINDRTKDLIPWVLSKMRKDKL